MLYGWNNNTKCLNVCNILIDCYSFTKYVRFEYINLEKKITINYVNDMNKFYQYIMNLVGKTKS